MSTPPSGTVTFLFADIEGSTRLWEERPDEMRAALAVHDALVRAAIDEHSGYAFSTGGDGFAAAFSRAHDAIGAARKAQSALADRPLLRVRMGIHTGEVQERDGDYFGPPVNRAARIMAAAHGGQVLVSSATAELLTAVDLVDLGEHRLRDLSRPEHVWQMGRGEFPLLRMEPARTNLPLQLSSFVGRERDCVDVADALRASRIVTLTGVGGVGKTRLALQVAGEAVPERRDGVWLVELASVTVEADVVDAIANALGMRSSEPATLSRVIDHLSGRDTLLVIDNCEHVLDEVTHTVSDIARRCPRVSFLLTSREGLGVAGERLIAVTSLGVPDAGASVERAAEADAVQLFVTRAADARRGFALTAANADVVAEICRRLDGMPLAIELAAAQVQAMQLSEIASRLDHRFRLLTRGSRGGMGRQQTLRTTIDWSYDLLDEPTRAVLQHLSVFADGCTLTAAEAVTSGDGVDTADVIEHLGALVRQSLLTLDSSGDDSRYRLLETVRQYAAEKLEGAGDAIVTRRRHAEWFGALA